MTKNIFMSYSRRELGFVDDVVSKLEGEGYFVWLDYRVLVPGTPWKGQIDKGLNDADTVLLVVSKASLASEYVALEWRHFLETNKRVILLIFEAVDLPTELEKYEWVDFRGSYKAGLNELFSQLKQPIVEEHPVPETGFKAPVVVWVTIGLSVLTAIYSLSVFWTLFIPWILLPLPYRIYKRSFNFTQVQAALLMLPFAVFFTFILRENDQLITTFFSSIIWGVSLFFLLRSPAMQRWGKPEATMPKFANPYKFDDKAPTPVPFYVDYAVQDRVVAEDLTATLKKYGHPQVDDIHSAKAVLALISRYKSDTEADPEKQVVFPVIVQTNENMAKKLSKIQWIDFRPGVRKLDAIARLLDNPAELLKALGMRPVSSQTVYSPIITTIYYFMVFLAVFTVGSSIEYFLGSGDSMLSISDEAYGSLFIQLILQMVLFSILTFIIVRGITRRAGWFSSFRSYIVGLVVVGGLLVWQFDMSSNVSALLEATGVKDDTSLATFLPFSIYFIGIFVMIFVFFRNRQDIKRWFPARK